MKLAAAEAARLSPVRIAPRGSAPLVLAVGTDETSEFIRQPRTIWDAWPKSRPAGVRAPLIIARRHPLVVVVDYADPASDLTPATLGLR